jgi:hypothetical protein
VREPGALLDDEGADGGLDIGAESVRDLGHWTVL